MGAKRTGYPQFKRVAPGLRVLVIAANDTEYRHWVNALELNPEQHEYVSKGEQLRAVRGIELVHLPGWHKSNAAKSDYWWHLTEIGTAVQEDPYGRIIIR